jgi:hypothetical protein
MRHFRILGWLWLVFGLFWSSLAACALLAPSVQPEQIKTTSVWWTDLIVSSLEGAFFVASAIFGFGLLRRWRRAQVVAGVLGGVLLGVCVVAIPSPWFPPTAVPMKIVWLSPFLCLALYSLITPLLIKYEPKAAS